MGDIRKTQGGSLAALEEYRKAAADAERGGDREQLCRAQLSVMLTVGETRDGAQALLAMLPEVRRNVAAAGDPHLTAALHIYVGQIETQRNLMPRARQHFRIAASLLSAHPNDYLQGSLAIAELCVDYLDSEFERAFRQTETARQFVESSGHAGMRIAMLSNLGHLLLAQGQFERAEGALKEGLDLAPAGSRVEAAILEGFARLRLAQGRDEECRRLLGQVIDIQRATSATLYEQCCTYVTRLRLLIRSGPTGEIAQLIEQATPVLEQAGDQRLQALLHLYRAEYAALCHEHELADRLVREVNWSYDGRSLDLLAEIERVSAVHTAAGHQQPDVARALFARSMRIARSLGNTTAFIESRRDRDRCLSSLEIAGADRWLDGSAPRERHELVDRAARLLDQAGVPALLGFEAVEIVSLLGCASEVFVVRRHADGRLERVIDPEELTLEPLSGSQIEHTTPIGLGTDGAWAWELHFRPALDMAGDRRLCAVRRLVSVALERQHARRADDDHHALWPPTESAFANGGGPGTTPTLEAHLAIAQKLATSNITMLITGETGTGKEVLARGIHDASSRAGRPFVPFNCATVPRDIVESQLFGFRRGAFTGAHESSPGVVRAAAGGTLFLDEIGELSPEVQPKLLRFLESHEIHPLGEPQPIKVDVRIIAATNQNLDGLVQMGRFREDLFYRLNVIRFRIPPLRERREEIPALAEHFLRRFSEELKKDHLRLAEETMEYLVLYSWPGNVRQLANQLQRMAALAEPGAVLMPVHLSPEIASTRRTVLASDRRLEPTEIVVRLDQPLAAASDHVERALIAHAMSVSGGRVDRAAEMLGLSRKGLYLKRQRFERDAASAR